MEAYTDFAEVYDIFMDNTPYQEWCSFLLEQFQKNNITKDLVLDLGCGTGTLTRMLKEAGYDMIGIDYSEEMLSIARQKEEETKNKKSILYLQQDMREFELYGTVKAIVCVCDSINYLLEDEDVIKTFQLVNNYLDPKGLFIMDFNTVYKYSMVIGDTTIAENRDNCSFIWENYYHEKEHINEYDLTIFTKKEELYRKSVETHYQRGYTVEEMTSFIKRSGLELVGVMDADTHEAVTEKSERVYVIARECTK